MQAGASRAVHLWRDRYRLHADDWRRREGGLSNDQPAYVCTRLIFDVRQTDTNLADNQASRQMTATFMLLRNLKPIDS
jgi:hypothetical protein